MSQWIGLLGKILTGFTMVFTIKYIGGSGSNFPIIQFYVQKPPDLPVKQDRCAKLHLAMASKLPRKAPWRAPPRLLHRESYGPYACDVLAVSRGIYIYMCMYIRIYVILQIMYIYKIVSDYIRYGIILLYYAYTWPVKLKISNMSHKHLDLSNMFFLPKKSEAASAKNQDRTWLNVWWTGKLVCRIITY